MPAGDLIFQRLELATDSELKAVARALDELEEFERVSTRPEKLDLLSRTLRSDAGSFLGNWGRSDHELAYTSILEDVVAKAAAAAEWSVPKYPSDTDVRRVEDYIVSAFTFALTKEKSTKEQRKKAEAEAARGLTATTPASDSSSVSGTAVRAAMIAGQLLLKTNPYVLTAGVVSAVGLSIAWIASPAMRRVTPAVLVLIHIRRRLDAEAQLQGAA